MALFDGLLGGGGSDPMDIYGDLFTEKQRAALRDQQMTQGLLNAAAVFSKAGQASRLPVSIPWGEAAQALGGSGDEAMNRMLKGMQVAEEVRKSQQERAILAKAAPYVEAIMAKFGLDRPTATKVAAQMTSGNAPIAPGAPTGGPPGSNAPPPPAPAYPSGDIGGPVPGGFQGDFPGDVPAPAKAAGLLGPPGQTDPWAQYAGLLGGGTGSQSPFDPTTLDPTGPRGSPDRRIQIEQLSGEAAPAMPFPTRQDPNKPRSAWEQGYTYDQPKVPFGQDPGDALPGQATRGDPRGMTPVIRAAAQRYGVDPEVALRVAQSEGLSQFSGDGGKSGTAFQLYTGGGLGNDFQKQTGLDPLDPKNEPAAIDWAMRNASRTGWGPYRGAAKTGIGPDAGLPGRTGIRIEPLGGDAAPAGATPPGTIPGLGDQPEALAALNAMLKMGGMKSDPFGSLLETYYKSPGYLMQAEAAKQLGGLPFEGPKAAAIAKAQQQYIQQNAAHQSDLDIAKDLITKGGLVQQPDGSYKQITSISEGLAAVEAAKPTGDIKEYNFYAQQAKDRGDIPKPFATWDIERKRAAATSINTTEGLESAQMKARIAIDQKIAIDANEKALAVRQMMPLLDEAIQLARKTPEGLAGPFSAKFGQMAAAFGIAPTPGQSNAELLGAINQRLIPMVREPGAQSNAEMDAYLRAGPALMGTADGRIKIAEMTKAIGQRSIEIARVYRENPGAPDLYDKLAKLDKPLFTEEQRAAMQAASMGAATPGLPPEVPVGSVPAGSYQGKPVYRLPDGSMKVLQ